MSDPQILLDRYELGGLIGAGGSARVHRAVDRRLDRPVAVKLLDSAVARSADPAAHERFVREARSAARFSHPNAVATYDAGESDGRLFIVMELVDGGSLADRIAADAPIADRHVVRVGTELLSALAAAHAAGLVHRDVKPANVLLTRAGTVKLADFGIARRFDEVTSALTAEGMVMGTRAYLAPEAARGDDVGPAADLYAVGATLYEMATGARPPVSAPDSDRGPDPRSVVGDVSAGLAAAISTALAGRPERRFDSAEAMATALQAPAAPTGGVAPTMAMPAAAASAPNTSSPDAASTRPMSAAAASAPTANSSHAAPTRPMPARAAAPMVQPDRRRRPRRWLPAVAMVILVGGVVAALAVVAARDTESTGVAPTPAGPATTQPPATASPTSDATPSTTAPATTTPPTTTPPTTTPTTTPPTTTPPTTAPPTTVPPGELIPGFPDTDDVEQFIDQLRDRQSTAGKQSRKLGDGLRDILRNDKDRDEKIQDLADDIVEWVEDDELDPTVAGRAVEFLVELGESAG